LHDAKGVDVSTIHLAVCVGDLGKVKSFIKEGTDLNAKDNSGLTPRDIAVDRGHTEISELLREHGAEE